MKLCDYLKKYNRAGFTQNEKKAFGLPDLKKGWKKRYAEYEAKETIIELLTSEEVVSDRKKNRKKLQKKLEFAITYEKSDDKLLCLMENANGLLKIGISVDPIKRARSLTTGSGVTVHLVAAWKLDKNARSVEGLLHKSFEKYRLHGEWFSPGSVTVEALERRLSCNWEKLILNQSFQERKLADVEFDVYNYSFIKAETAKATLFVIDGKAHWCPKSRIYHLNTEDKEVKVAKGQFDTQLAA